MRRLVYDAAGTLTFGSAGERHTVAGGVSFVVDDATAAILLEDPLVIPAAGDVVPRGTHARASGPITTSDLPKGASKSGGNLERHRELKARAKELGLAATGKVADLEARITAEEQRLAEEAAATAAAASSSGEGNQGGGQTPADDPDASATGEAGTPPASGEGGATVLGAPDPTIEA
jgi:hypothetical protein